MKNNTIIIGDSYSTFEGYIPDGYEIYYFKKGRPETDVTKVTQTWWHQVLEEKNWNLVLNNSWCGSTICYTGYDNVDCSESSSFIYRFRQLIATGFFEENEIHKVFIFGGTNDSWSDAPLGESKYSDWEEQDFYCVLPAICYFMQLVKQTLPHADIYCMINTDIKDEITACLKAGCERHSITPVTFDHIDKRSDHPTIEGMKHIKDCVLRTLKD